MKKLLVLLIVLGFAVAAPAAVLPVDGLMVTVNGEAAPDIIRLMPSQTFELDLELLQGFTILNYGIQFKLNNSQGELLYGGIVFPQGFDLAPKVATGSGPLLVKITAGQLASPKVPGAKVLMQGLIFHCVETTPVILTVSVYTTTKIGIGEAAPVTVANGTVLKTITIEQIPEPVTIALLGLGGLFLRRRIV